MVFASLLIWYQYYVIYQPAPKRFCRKLIMVGFLVVFAAKKEKTQKQTRKRSCFHSNIRNTERNPVWLMMFPSKRKVGKANFLLSSYCHIFHLIYSLELIWCIWFLKELQKGSSWNWELWVLHFIAANQKEIKLNWRFNQLNYLQIGNEQCQVLWKDSAHWNHCLWLFMGQIVLNVWELIILI